MQYTSRLNLTLLQSFRTISQCSACKAIFCGKFEDFREQKNYTTVVRDSQPYNLPYFLFLEEFHVSAMHQTLTKMVYGF